MGVRKKSDNINAHYPILGFRIAKQERDKLLKDFESTIELLRTLPEYRRVNLKKNAVFLRALEIGIENIRKKKSLA